MAANKPTNTAPKPMVEDDRDPRHKAGQNYIDHTMARYYAADDLRKDGRAYDEADIERASYLLGRPSPARKELQFGDEGYGRGVMNKKSGGAPEEEAKKIGYGYKKGGSVKSSASKRADGIATKGKTKGRMI